MKEHAYTVLRVLVPAGSAVYTATLHTARGGMSRRIALLIPIVDYKGRGAIANISGYAREVLDLKDDRWPGAVRIDGCGMDMGFDLVYRLATALYGDGRALRHEWI